jgi:hypothetical protein
LTIVDELETALDEIKKNERDLNLLGMAAEELISRTDELNGKMMESEDRASTAESAARVAQE